MRIVRNVSGLWVAHRIAIEYTNASDRVIHAGALPSGFPRIPGHEVVGDIVAAHPDVKNFKIGQRVGAPWQRGFCGTCRFCTAGKPMGCAELSRFSTGML